MNNKKLVYDGILFKVYQWEQEMFDGTKETFERAVRRPSVQLLVVKDSKLLIYEEEQPSKGKFLSLPGGMVEWEESFEDAGKRELLEETGLTGKFKFFMEQDFAKTLEWKTKYYVVSNIKKIQDPKPDNGEKISPKFVSLDEFFELSQRSDFRNKFFANFLKLKKLENGLEQFKVDVLGSK